MPHHLHHSLWLLTLTLMACRIDTTPAPHRVSLNTDVTLAPADRVVFDQADLEVRLVSIVEDSRCPVGAACIWAGRVVVRLAVHGTSQADSQHDVVEGQSATIGRYRVMVEKVLPKPVSTHKTAQQDYRVTVSVKRYE